MMLHKNFPAVVSLQYSVMLLQERRRIEWLFQELAKSKEIGQDYT